LLVIIGLTGITLSLILSLVFTEKIRKQITHLSHAADITRSGNLKNRVTMLTKDELGSLGTAFNSMLDDLEKNQNIKNEYTEFIALINQNPSLKEISEAALTKIIKSTGSTVGRLYLVDEGKMQVLSTYGLQNELATHDKEIDLYQRAIEKNETVELSFSENGPVISSGLLKLEIKNLLVYPVLYSKKVIAILELASVSSVKPGIREYLDNIHHQLAIGLSNAYAFHQLENLVVELQKLNEDYHKQNEQIVEQNKTLLGLHRELKEKAEELEIQKAKAIEATNLKSQFLASMSHELKTPLNSVLGLTELVLNDKTVSLQGRERLEVVLRNGNRLMNLINDILNFSRMESGKMDVRMEEFTIGEILSEIRIQIEPLLRSRDIEFEIDCRADKDEVINTDKFKVTQILINLLSNAVKFTEKGSIKFSIEIDGSILKLEVADTGIGIAEKDIPVIYDEFRQIDGSNKRKYSGTGLGLAISRRYAEMLNGTLACVSTPGEGSVFTLTVPVLRGEKRIRREELTKKEFSHLILLLDHIDEHVKVIEDYFALKEYGVIHAHNISEVFQKAKETKPAIIAVNTRRPEAEIWSILVELRQNSITGEIPVVLYTIVDELNIGYGLQIYDYFLKPSGADGLPAIIRRLNESTGRVICSAEYIGSRDMLPELPDGMNEGGELGIRTAGVHLAVIEDIQTAFRHIARQLPDLVIVDLDYCGQEGIMLIKRLKDFSETKEIPVVLCFSETLGEKESVMLSNAIEEAAIKSKGHPIDILKVMRDRIQLEEGVQTSDTSGFWAAETLAPAAVPSSGAGFGEKKLHRNKILIVDDDTDTLFTVSEIVHQTGCETALARNGLECLSILQHFSPDLILLDIMMPQMDGFETIKKIRSDSGFSDVPVFALTALAMIEEKEILLRNGFNDLIPKPVNAALLISRIESILQ
ncbi:MAG: response regulator, partial [Syntrophothermus sp.]